MSEHQTDLPAAPAFPQSQLPSSPLDDGLAALEAAALDDEAELARYTSFVLQPDGTQQARSRLVLDGLHCAACAGLIEQALRQVDGVHGAAVQAASRRAQVTWDPARTRASELVAAVQGAGYQAYPDTAIATHTEDAAEDRRALWRLFVAGFCMMQVMMYATPGYVATPDEIGHDVVRLLAWASWLLSLPVVLFSSTPFYAGAWRALRQRRIGMDVPVALGIVVTFIASTGAAFAVGEGTEASLWGHEVYFDSLTMFVTFLLGGRWLERRARRRAAQALDSVLHRLPQSVERVLGDGSTQAVSPTRLSKGDHVRVAVGQAFPADGALTAGATDVDEALLTGESRPLPRAAGAAVLAGSINLGQPVTMRVERLGADTRYQRIVALMHEALTERPAWVRVADRIAGPFLWCVLLLALGAAVVWSQIDPGRAVWVAVAVLIVTCPCALSLAAPAAMVAAAGNLARRGVLVQRVEALEALARIDRVVFDKTGTLTDERLRLTGVVADPARSNALLQHAASLAAHSRHPVSRALADAEEARDLAQPDAAGAAAWFEVREHAGFGLEAVDAEGVRWRLGSAAWAAGVGAAGKALAEPGGAADGVAADPALRLWLCSEQGERAGFALDERLRPGARSALEDLQSEGLRVMLLSGDHTERVQQMAARLGLNAEEAKAGASPQDKLAVLEQLQQAGERVAAVGDGINDAPLLARADVSFAMGHGAALAQTRADFIVLGSRPQDVVATRRLAHRTLRIVHQNLLWALLYNTASVPLALLGWMPPWLAGLGMALSSLLVILNAARLTREPGQVPQTRPVVARAAGA